MSQVFFHRKRRKPNGQTDEVTLGRPFAAVIIAVCLATVAHKGSNVDIGALIGHVLRWLGR